MLLKTTLNEDPFVIAATLYVMVLPTAEHDVVPVQVTPDTSTSDGKIAVNVSDAEIEDFSSKS